MPRRDRTVTSIIEDQNDQEAITQDHARVSSGRRRSRLPASRFVAGSDEATGR